MTSTASVEPFAIELPKATLNDDAEADKQESKDNDAVLTPIRAHYLKKTLISLQFSKELEGLTTVSPNPAISPFSYLGLPFTPPPKDAPLLDFPFMRFIFRQFILSFPFLAAAPKDFFPQKVQPFISSVLSRNLSANSPFDEEAEKAEQATREKILSKLEKQFAVLLGSAAKLVEDEEVVRLTQTDLERLETLAKRRRERELKLKDSFDVNVIGVRTVVDKGRVRSKAHEEFIIRTRRAHRPDIFVARRYGDFRTLADTLRKMHGKSEIPLPPAKDRSTVAAPVTSPTSQLSPTDENSSLSRTQTYSSNYSTDDPTSHSATASAARLTREKNRLTLRSYLNALLSSSTLANSPVLRDFLTAGSIQLTRAEVEDARRREEADFVREEGRKRFAKELASKVDALRTAMKDVKRDVMGKDGLLHAFSIIKETPDVRNLPTDFKAVLEWARISLASTIFHHFVASDTSSESLTSLKRIHGLMPYFVLKGILKISNPVAMIRGVLDLFLAQPFGGRSLLQRMFTTSLSEEVKGLQQDIEAVMDKVDDPVLCEKIRLFVYAPAEIQAMFKADAVEEKFDIITVVLRSSEEPRLSREQLTRVHRAHLAHAEYKRQRQASGDDSDDDSGPSNDDAWLYEDLTELGKLYTRLRDREQLMELIFEGTTADLLKDIITIFYSPLAQVYKAASIADSLGDLQTFINDLIRTVEQAEAAGSQDPSVTVRMFVDLVQRHEQSFYNFVHKVHTKGAGLFDSLLRWIELFISFVREGLGDPLSLEFLLPHTGPERADIMKEVDAVALYHYRLKVAHESKVRKRFNHGEGGSANGTSTTADEDDEATQALIDEVVRDFSFGDLVNGDVEDLVEDESGSEEDDSSSAGASETDETETETESEVENVSNGQIPHPMAPQSPATRRVPPSAPLPHAHSRHHHPQSHQHRHHRPQAHTHTHAQASKSVSSLNSPTPTPTPITATPKPPARKRSLSSLLGRKSSSDLRQSAKVAESAPPVPPLPPRVNATPILKMPIPPQRSGSIPSSSPYNLPSPVVSTSSSSINSNDRIQRQPMVDEAMSSKQRKPSVDEEERASPSGKGKEKEKKKKKKKGPDIKPPELKVIPALLPLFIEMMRPKLRPRQV